MVFRKLLGVFGVGGPSVDTVLAGSDTRPGGTVDGQIHILGGDHDAKVEEVALELVTVDTDGYVRVVHRTVVADAFPLPAGERKQIPFSYAVPWQAPLTNHHGRALEGMTMGLRTALAVDRAVDTGDLDPVRVHPLPVQERILDAFGSLGFQIKRTGMEYGQAAPRIEQELRFYQEIEFLLPPEYARDVNEFELAFVADPDKVEVILELETKTSRNNSYDTHGRFRVAHNTVDQTDWATVVDDWLRAVQGYHANRPLPRLRGGRSGGDGDSGGGYDFGDDSGE